jgi:hypothetical protein
VAAQGGASQTAPQAPKSPDVTFTGCLIQGSAPTSFILDRARIDPQSRTEKARTFVVVASAEDLNLAQHVNHEVTVMGQAEAKTAPEPQPGKKVDEKDLPKLQAKSLTMVSDTCTAVAKR